MSSVADHETHPAVAVVGIFVGEPATVHDRSLEEMIFAAAQATVADAGIGLDDIDGVVVSGYDQTDGRVISCMVTSGPAAGVGRDLTMIASSSEHAFVYSVMRLLAGLGRNVLVLGWGKPSESVSPEHAQLVAAEPFVLRPTGMNDTLAAAFQASVLAHAGAGGTPGDGAAGKGGDRVVAWPLTETDVPAEGDAVCGLLLTVADAVPAGASPAWVRGVGWATDRYELGDRDLAAMPALRAAAERAYSMAGLEGPAPASVRVNCASRGALGAVLDALTLGDAANRASTVDDGPGELAFPTHAAGLVAMAMAARDVRDAEADGIAVGASTHGFAGQGAAVAVLEVGGQS